MISKLFLYVLWQIAFSIIGDCKTIHETDESLFRFEKKQYATTNLAKITGASAQLPCNMTVAPNDTVLLALWFKEGVATPIYSYDVRELLGGEPKHWWDSDILGSSRAFFNAHSQPSHLLIRKLTLEDAGLYKCRVDFKIEPTRNTRVNLTVVEPPRHVIILDKDEKEIRSFVGPVSEGDAIHLSCVAEGGIPPPKLQWLLNEEIYDSTVELQSADKIRNDLLIRNLTRDYLRAQLTCEASFEQAYPTIIIVVTIDMNLEPLDVRIQKPNGPLSAGRTYEIICSSSGSRPPAVLKWWKADKRLTAFSDQTSKDGNITSSVLKLNVDASFEGQNLTCSAENKKQSSPPLKDTITLTVYYRPIVTIKLSPLLDPKNIFEGNDVYFTCQARANPQTYKVMWLHNDKVIVENNKEGILVTNDSLVLQKVTRKHAGEYSCLASNVEGDGQSRPLDLRIQYAPVCKKNQTKVYGVSKFESIHVTCEVEAVPQATTFRWWFNNTAETLEVPGSGFTVGIAGRSVITYTPTSDNEYGSLLCEAENTQGKQAIPCLFNVVPTTPPQTPQNCSVFNVSANRLEIACNQGFNGGLKQSFIMEVYTTKPHQLYMNVTSKKPRFEVTGLESDNEVQLIIYAANDKGRSGITRLVAYTLKPPVQQLETRLGTGENNANSSASTSEMTPLVAILLGGGFVFACLASAIFISIKLKFCSRNRSREVMNVPSECSQMQLSSDPKFTDCSIAVFTSNTGSLQRPKPSGLTLHTLPHSLDERGESFQINKSHYSHPLHMDEDFFQEIPPPSEYAWDPILKNSDRLRDPVGFLEDKPVIHVETKQVSTQNVSFVASKASTIHWNTQEETGKQDPLRCSCDCPRKLQTDDSSQTPDNCNLNKTHDNL